MQTRSINPERPSWYITTSIPYVNAQPHIGFALELIQADVLARHQRLQGFEVRFQTGTDENSLKNVQAAEQEGIPTAQLVARNAVRFETLKTVLNLSWDDFIRTSAERRHVLGVYRFWQACDRRGDIYKRFYRGLYCVGCEQFFDEDELVAGRCPIHGTTPELLEEENYFFRLSHYEAELRHLIESDQIKITPPARKNEILSFIRQGLRDFSISRSRTRARGWGIPVPGDESQVIYVWFDALTNYITALAYAHEGDAYQQYWRKSTQRTHVIGKDIIRFHAIYWPAMLLSAGEPLPSDIFVHGFLTVEGRKISKSLGNAIDPVALVEQYGRDALRYYLLRKVPATGDADYTRDEFIRTYNADLADQLGNLLNRVTKMIAQSFAGIVPAPGSLLDVDRAILELTLAVQQEVACELAAFALHKAISAVWTLIAAVNKYIVETEPWKLARSLRDGNDDITTEQRLATALFVPAATLFTIARLLRPFLPDTAAAITHQLGQAPDVDEASPAGWGQSLIGAHVQPGALLFPKLSVDAASPVV